MSRIKTVLFAAAGLMMLTACAPHNAYNLKKGKDNMEQIDKGSLEQVRELCRSRLHKVQSRDDLLKQMYETAVLDDCLYAMDVEELERIWGIPVAVDFSGASKFRDIESEIGLYVIKTELAVGIHFSVILNQENYQKYGTIFPEGKFPEFFPKPERRQREMMTGRNLTKTSYIGKDDDQIQHGYLYYWKINGRAIVATNFANGAIPALGFYNHIERSPVGH